MAIYAEADAIANRERGQASAPQQFAGMATGHGFAGVQLLARERWRGFRRHKSARDRSETTADQ
jgi:hypothetical protein